MSTGSHSISDPEKGKISFKFVLETFRHKTDLAVSVPELEAVFPLAPLISVKNILMIKERDILRPLLVIVWLPRIPVFPAQRLPGGHPDKSETIAGIRTLSPERKI